MSNEARVKWWSMGVSFSFLITSVVLSTLCLLGSGASCLIFCVNSLTSLEAGPPHQFTMGRMGCSGLCILIRPFIVGAVGFIFTYFHLISCGINVLLSVTTFLPWD